MKMWLFISNPIEFSFACGKAGLSIRNTQEVKVHGNLET